jgi:hypothetical protein
MEQSSQFFVSTPLAGYYSPAGWALLCAVWSETIRPRQMHFFSSGRGAAAVRGRDLIFEDDRDSGRGRKSATSTDSQHIESAGSRKKRASPEVGHALRAAYQRTIAEDIPPEMLDLLGKLG